MMRRIWQEDNSATWYTDRKMLCAKCGKMVNDVVQVGERGAFYCFGPKNQCWAKQLKAIFSAFQEVDYVNCRFISKADWL